MSDEGQTSQFVDEIVECTLQALSENPAFDDATLARLRELASAPGLAEFRKVVEALSTGEGP